MLKRYIFIFGIILLTGMLVSENAMAQCSTLADDGSFDCTGFSSTSEQCTSPEYLNSISGTESGGQYNCVNPIGANGRYQFMDYTRSGLCGGSSGLPCVSQAAFANCPALQDAYFDAFNQGNWDALESCGATDAIGSTINGIEITGSCLMAMSHLGGAGGACDYVSSGGSYNPNDGATSLSTYCQKHGGKEVFASGSDCEVPEEEEEDDTEIPPVAACGKGPGMAVCDMPACSIGTPGDICGGLAYWEQQKEDAQEEQEESEPAEDNEWCEEPTGSGCAEDIAAAATANLGASTADVAATQGGALGCALAVSRIIQCAGEGGIGTELNTTGLYDSLDSNPNFELVSSGNLSAADLQPGDILVTRSDCGPAGHTGVYSGNGNIISNSSSGFQGSSPGTLQQNYDIGSWNSGVISRCPGGGSGVFRSKC
jgi:hypothetical protein